MFLKGFNGSQACLELSIRIYAFGLRYIPLNPFFAIDGVVVVTSLVLQFVVLFYIPDSSENSSTGVASNLLRIARLLRLLRLFVVMNKVQKSRASAHVLSKKAKYRKLGSPVERVLEILLRLKRDPLDGVEDRENLSANDGGNAESGDGSEEADAQKYQKIIRQRKKDICFQTRKRF